METQSLMPCLARATGKGKPLGVPPGVLFYRLATAFLLCLLLLGSGCGKLSRKASRGRFKVESCRIEYVVTGPVSGTELVWIADWGAREARLSTNSMLVMGKKVTTSELTLLDGGWFYKVALNDGTGMKMPMPMAGPGMQTIASLLPDTLNGKKVGTGLVAGRECDVLEFASPKAKLWMWKNIPLKTEVAMLGDVSVSEAVLVEENPTIPASAFTVPEGIAWTVH